MKLGDAMSDVNAGGPAGANGVSKGAARVPAVHRAGRVLDALAAASGPVSLAALATVTGMPKSTVLAVAQGLTGEGLLLRGQDGTYRLGPRLAQLAGAERQHRPLVSCVGMSVPSGDNPFFAAECRAVEDDARLLSARLVSRTGDRSAETQCVQLLELLEQGCDVLLVDPVATEGLEEAMSTARARGVPV